MTEGRDGFGPEQEKHQADHAADRLCGTAVLGTEQSESIWRRKYQRGHRIFRCSIFTSLIISDCSF